VNPRPSGQRSSWWRELVEPRRTAACLLTAAGWVVLGVVFYVRDGMTATLLIPAAMVGALIERASA